MIDRRSALIFLFSAFVPVVPILQKTAPKMPGAETGAKSLCAPEATAAKFTDVTAALGLDFRTHFEKIFDRNDGRRGCALRLR